MALAFAQDDGFFGVAYATGRVSGGVWGVWVVRGSPSTGAGPAPATLGLLLRGVVCNGTAISSRAKSVGS